MQSSSRWNSPPAKKRFAFQGRIDRIDTGIVAGKNVFNIFDYKTGKSLKFSRDEVKRGTALQLPLYAMAAMELLLNDRDARPWRAGYWNVAKDGFKENQSLKMFELSQGSLETIARLGTNPHGLGENNSHCWFNAFAAASFAFSIRTGIAPVIARSALFAGFGRFAHWRRHGRRRRKTQ